ncbi:hypothetical protein [Sediminimonas qiaohouensis]|uniref:hypothetical protein n=1 Tax=Sediminimonas qiaohouensis TaxID=552061 RepID=UPI0012ED2A5F|nr:hypothetical protein [Sediminimonas qiaohouensis]
MIEALDREIEQKKARRSDLMQKAKEEERRAETRRKIIYGGAFFAYLATLSPENERRVKAAIDAMIKNQRDRQFLGLSDE